MSGFTIKWISPAEMSGGFSPVDLAVRRLGEACVRLCGSGCLEFGADDLWPRGDTPTS